MFKELLRDIVEQTEGGIGAMLMGFDGIPVDNYVSDDADRDIEAVGQEYSVILSQISKAAEMLDAGSAREVTIQAENLTAIIRLLTEEYFVAIAMHPGGNFGKARFLLRTRAAKLANDLS